MRVTKWVLAAAPVVVAVSLWASYERRIAEIAEASQAVATTHRELRLDSCIAWAREQVRSAKEDVAPNPALDDSMVLWCAARISSATEADLSMLANDIEKLRLSLTFNPAIMVQRERLVLTRNFAWEPSVTQPRRDDEPVKGLLEPREIDRADAAYRTWTRLRAVFAWREVDDHLTQLASAGPDLQLAMPRWQSLEPESQQVAELLSISLPPIAQMLRDAHTIEGRLQLVQLDAILTAQLRAGQTPSVPPGFDRVTFSPDNLTLSSPEVVVALRRERVAMPRMGGVFYTHTTHSAPPSPSRMQVKRKDPATQ